MTYIFGIVFIVLYAVVLYLFAYLINLRKKLRSSIFQTKNQQLTEPKKAPLLTLHNLRGESVGLFESNVKNHLLVCINEKCVYCDMHLETLLNEINYLKRRGLNKVKVVVNEESKTYGEVLSAKYSSAIEVLSGDEEVFKQYEISFFPAFIVVDQNQNIILSTPIPQVIIRFWSQFMQMSNN